MIVCQVHAGLGNQLFQIFTTIAAGLNSGHGFGFYRDIQKGGTVRGTYWHSFLKQLQTYIVPHHTSYKRKYVDAEFHYKPFFRALRVFGDNIKLQGYFQSYKYFENYFDQILELIGMHEIQVQVRDKVSHSFPFLRSFENTISIHFRLGDYLKLQKYHNILSLNYYRVALHTILTSMDPHVQDLQVLYFYEKRDGELVERWIDELSVEFPMLEFINVLDGLADWEEMLTMSCCKHNIIANSTFSWWGAYLNTHSDKLVCYPSAWFGPKNASKNTADLFPVDWIRIDCDKKI
jgi:hypothetical protein